MLFHEAEVTRLLSKLNKNDFVVSGNRVTRVIDANELIMERMRQIEQEQEQERREELLRKRREAMEAAGEDGETPFVEGLFPEEMMLDPEPEIDYVTQAMEQAEKIVSEANANAISIKEEAKREAEIQKQMARQEGFESGYREGSEKAQAELDAGQQRLDQLEQELRDTYDQKLMQMEPELLDTILTVFDNVFHMQFCGKRQMLLQLVTNVMQGIRETKQLKIHVCEEELEHLRAEKDHLIQMVGTDVLIDIIADPDLGPGQCVIDTDSGLYDCSLDVELDALIRDLRSLCIN